jgi:hypothetical protein
MHGQVSIRLEALFSASERGFCFLDGEKGECFNLLPVGWFTVEKLAEFICPPYAGYKERGTKRSET